ncbi:lactate utilization protein [Clostridium paridis]|uniref:Lactate utilization protein n=1 Tax=Clostridium paridis TaxID=2803863 RepID=A0A937K403_9CLOT|nr:lactate utilization protein [Clostridium paridis]MBL4932142.1 lactate utilization protein [Clostridium paridis]
MDNNISWYIEKQVERTINNLNNRNMEGYFVKDRFELINKVKGFISIGSNVGVGDSLTLSETGVLDLLRNGDYNFLDKYKEGLTKKDKREIYIKNFGSDSFVSSTNAITENGELYNIDGNGSRVAPMLYGPNQVIIVVGINKIVKDIEAAEKRVRQYSAPIDAKRLNKDTPCTKIGYCVDCKSTNRICNDFVIIRGQFNKGRIKVIIVGENLGY